MKKALPQTQIPVDQLNSGMKIVAYTSFNKQYQAMRTEICHFIRHNFKGTAVKINRDERALHLEVEHLQEGDTLLRIYNFPESLKKITEVKPELIGELKRRGMTGFEIEKRNGFSKQSKKDLKKIIQKVDKASSSKVIQKKQKSKNIVKQVPSSRPVEQANYFVDSVRKCARLKEEAATSIQESMDSARNGKVKIGELQETVNNILEESSAEAMSAVMNLRQSDQTYDHCIDVGALFQSTYRKIIETRGIPSAFKSNNQAMLAGFLHDFGKSKIPKEILDATTKYGINSKEMKLLRSHPLYGAVMLSDLDMPKAAINMTHYHHIKQDIAIQNSYPEGVSWDEVTYETRLLSIVDIYQALAGRRMYKRSWPAPATMRYLDALAGIEYDAEAWEDFQNAMGIYPKGSLVQLSDNSLGFVMSVPENGNDLERPFVAVVRNSVGVDLTHHYLVDLEKERDMSIVKDLDALDVFGDKAFDIFTRIQVD
jgi:HD-GYP domain-containing protein (c-di-GMP phosphodiesterase class II)